VLQRKISVSLIMIAIISLAAFIFVDFSTALGAFRSIIGFIVIYVFEIYFTKGKSMEEKIINQEKKESQRDQGTTRLLNWLKQKIGLGGISIIALLLLTSYLAYAVGVRNAGRKYEFPVISLNQKEFAVVSVRGNGVIAVPFNRIKREFLEEMYFYDLENISEKDIAIKIENLGFLTNRSSKK